MKAVHSGIRLASAPASGQVAHSKIASDGTTIASTMRRRPIFGISAMAEIAAVDRRSAEKPRIELAGDDRHRLTSEEDALPRDAHAHNAAALRGLEPDELAPAEPLAPVRP